MSARFRTPIPAIGLLSVMSIVLLLASTLDERPVVLLTKLDACDDPEPLIAEVEEAAMGVPVHALSVHGGTGLDILNELIQPGETVVFVGSSGVGKSTLVNHLTAGETMATGAVRAGDQ